MKSFFATLALGASLFTSTSFAKEYQCFFDQLNGGQNKFSGQLVLKSSDSSNYVFEYDDYQGRASKTLPLGKPVDLGKGESCVEYENVGMCLLGPHDPYEFCRTQCVSWGTTSSNVVLSNSANPSFMKMKLEETVNYTKKSFVVFSSDKSYVKQYEGKCIQKEVVDLMNATKETLPVLKVGEDFRLMFAPYAAIEYRAYAKFDEASVFVTDAKSGKSQSVRMGEIGKMIASGQAVALYPVSKAEFFDLSKVQVAKCVSTNLDGSQNNLRLAVTADKDVVVTDQAEKVTSLGQIVEVKGRSQVAYHSTLISSYLVSDSVFLLNGMLCSVQK